MPLKSAKKDRENCEKAQPVKENVFNSAELWI